jgi:hypothetical protein
VQARRGLRQRVDARQLLDRPKVWLQGRRRLGLRNGVDDRLERRSVLDRLLERLDRRGLRLWLSIGLLLALLALSGLGRPEELRERALTHAGALSRH